MKSFNSQKKLTILVCDDDLADIKLIKSYLKSNNSVNFDVIEADTQEKIEDAIKADNIDLILLDYQMPGKSGFDWLEELKEKNIAPVVMITGTGDESVAVDAMKLGAKDYIPKDKLSTYELGKSILNSIERWEIENERDALLGIAAHEFRNPLATIIGYTEMLITYGDREELKKGEIFETVLERANHLLTMINSLLDITRIDKGTISISKKKIDLTKYLKQKTGEYNLIAKRKNIEIKYIPSVTSLFVNIDEDRLGEVIMNLLDNAVKYSPYNSTVNVDLNKNDNYAIFRVIDEGPGIKEDELKYLFKLFSNVKISSQTTGGEKSTGLGLAICRKIVSLHSGEIDVQSKIGKGTTFIVKLPLSYESNH